MLSEKAKRELREAASSSALREDFAAMSANERRASARMSIDDLILFLTAAGSMFDASLSPLSHEPYPRARI